MVREVQNDDSLIVRCTDNPMDVKLDVKDIPQMVLLILLHEPPSLEVPDFDGLVVACADEAPRSGIESKRTHECVMPNECTYTFACRCIPYFDLTIARAGHDVIVLEFNAREPAIAIESAQARPAFDVPQHHLGIPAGAYDEPVLQTNGIDGALMPGKRAVQLESFPVPHPDLCIFGAAHDPLIVNAKVQNTVQVPFQLCPHSCTKLSPFTDPYIPNARLPVAASTDHKPLLLITPDIPVLLELETENTSMMAPECTQAASSPNIPGLDRPVTGARDDSLAVKLETIDAVGVSL